MAQRIISAAGTVAILWFLGMATIAVIAVTLEGDVSGGALGGIVTAAMLVSAIVARTVQPFARLPRQRRIAYRLLFVVGLFGAWLVIGITAWRWDGGNVAVAVAVLLLALLRAAFPPPPREPTQPVAS